MNISEQSRTPVDTSTIVRTLTSNQQVIVIACARFNDSVTRPLLEGATKTLQEAGLTKDLIRVAWVPGSFELPLAAKTAAGREDVAAVICLGAVIRGGTPHFEYVSHAAATGILQAGMETGKPVVFGVLTTDTAEQAFERAGGKVGNKGVDAAWAALEMLDLVWRLGRKTHLEAASFPL